VPVIHSYDMELLYVSWVSTYFDADLENIPRADQRLVIVFHDIWEHQSPNRIDSRVMSEVQRAGSPTCGGARPEHHAYDAEEWQPSWVRNRAE
jgi:hypothetical protein